MLTAAFGHFCEGTERENGFWNWMMRMKKRKKMMKRMNTFSNVQRNCSWTWNKGHRNDGNDADKFHYLSQAQTCLPGSGPPIKESRSVPSFLCR